MGREGRSGPGGAGSGNSSTSRSCLCTSLGAAREALTILRVVRQILGLMGWFKPGYQHCPELQHRDLLQQRNTKGQGFTAAQRFCVGRAKAELQLQPLLLVLLPHLKQMLGVLQLLYKLKTKSQPYQREKYSHPATPMAESLYCLVHPPATGLRYMQFPLKIRICKAAASPRCPLIQAWSDLPLPVNLNCFRNEFPPLGQDLLSPLMIHD